MDKVGAGEAVFAHHAPPFCQRLSRSLRREENTIPLIRFQAMSAPPYMKLYVAEWTADTQHLTCEQDGAYGRLVRAMWRAEGSLPADPVLLARIAGLEPRRWREISPQVLELFTLKDGKLAHKRLAKEAKKYRDVVSKNKRNGKSGGLQSGYNRRIRKANPDEANAKPNRSKRSHNQNQNQNQTPIGELIDSSPNRRRAPALSLVVSKAPIPLEWPEDVQMTDPHEDRQVVAEQMRQLAKELTKRPRSLLNRGEGS